MGEREGNVRLRESEAYDLGREEERQWIAMMVASIRGVWEGGDADTEGEREVARAVVAVLDSLITVALKPGMELTGLPRPPRRA